MSHRSEIEFRTSPPLTDAELNELFADSWDAHESRIFSSVLSRSLAYVCAYCEGQLVGFVNVAWDSGAHAFILDTTVRRSFWRGGIGRELVRRAETEARLKGAQWLHVDFEAQLERFYQSCGFRPSLAGLIRLL